MSSKITLQNKDGTYTIEIPDDNMDMPSIVDNLLIPLFLAAGYHPNTVNSYIGERDE